MYTRIARSSVRLNEAISQFHPYEGHPMQTVVYPIRLLKELGVENLIGVCSVIHGSSNFDIDFLVQSQTRLEV